MTARGLLPIHLSDRAACGATLDDRPDVGISWTTRRRGRGTTWEAVVSPDQLRRLLVALECPAAGGDPELAPIHRAANMARERLAAALAAWETRGDAETSRDVLDKSATRSPQLRTKSPHRVRCASCNGVVRLRRQEEPGDEPGETRIHFAIPKKCSHCGRQGATDGVDGWSLSVWIDDNGGAK